MHYLLSQQKDSGRQEYDSERYQQIDNIQGFDAQNKQKKQSKKSSLLQNMEKMEQKRQERREKMNQMKQQKLEKEQLNKESNRNVDIDFEMLIEQERLSFQLQHVPISNNRLSVIVRKRPLFQKEEVEGELDSISCTNPIIRVHEPKFKVDGITKFVENQDFQFDNTFSEKESTEDVYRYSLQPLIKCIFDYGVVTCFAYGQTGSGKTYTMRGLQQHYINDIFNFIQNNQSFSLTMSFFEIYGGKCFDLLNERNLLNILEDKNNNVQIQNLVEKPVRDQLEMIEIIEQAANIRTTHATEANEESSRSHAICQIVVKEGNGNFRGKLIMVDLAGSERAQDCQSNSKQRRQEGANINQSLLALKECVRAMDMGAQHVPFRGSKLTLVLRDSFLSKSQNSHIVMFACISPGSSSSDHTVNTLRYADRLKENTGIKSDVIKIIEDQSKNKRKKWNQPQISQPPPPPSVGQKKNQIEDNDSNKKNEVVSKKNLIQKFEASKNDEKQYDHTQYLMNNAKNKENLQSVDNIPSINQQEKHVQEKKQNQQPKPSQISKIPPITQPNQIQSNSSQTQNQAQQQVNSTNTPTPVVSALAQLQREKREERPQTQQKRQNSVGKKAHNNANNNIEQNNSNLNNLLQQKSLNTEPASSGVSNLSNIDQSKGLSQKTLKQIIQSNPVTTQNNSQQQMRINSAHPNTQQNNNQKEEGHSNQNNSFHQGGKKVQNQQQVKKGNQPQQNQDNIATINPRSHARDVSSNNSNKQNNNNHQHHNQNQNDQSLNDHILQKNKEVQENIEKAQQHQIEQKTKDLIVQQLKEKQEDMFSSHMSAIKEDANLLSLESGLLTDCQRDGFMDCDIDSYVKKFESIVSKKLFMYNMLQQKMDTLKKMRVEYTNKYTNQTNPIDNKQTNNHNKQEDPSKKRQSFLLKKKVDN